LYWYCLLFLVSFGSTKSVFEFKQTSQKCYHEELYEEKNKYHQIFAWVSGNKLPICITSLDTKVATWKKKMTAEGKLANYSPKAKHTGLFIWSLKYIDIIHSYKQRYMSENENKITYLCLTFTCWANRHISEIIKCFIL
jgi:hypothetical protein